MEKKNNLRIILVIIIILLLIIIGVLSLKLVLDSNKKEEIQTKEKEETKEDNKESEVKEETKEDNKDNEIKEETKEDNKDNEVKEETKEVQDLSVNKDKVIDSLIYENVLFPINSSKICDAIVSEGYLYLEGIEDVINNENNLSMFEKTTIRGKNAYKVNVSDIKYVKSFGVGQSGSRIDLVFINKDNVASRIIFTVDYNAKLVTDIKFEENIVKNVSSIVKSYNNITSDYYFVGLDGNWYNK